MEISIVGAFYFRCMFKLALQNMYVEFIYFEVRWV